MHKKWVIRAIILTLFPTICPLLAIAETQPVDLAISGGMASYTWKENTAVGNPKESGAIWTIDGNIGAAPFGKAPQLRLGGDAQVFFGRVDYDTFIQTTGTPVNTDTDYFGLKFEGGAGWTHLEATVYWQATRFGKSNEVVSSGCPTGCLQPKSDQDVVGIKVGFVF